jgi:hypothetical protein
MAVVALIALALAFPLFAIGDASGKESAPAASAPQGSAKAGRAVLRLTSLRPVTVAGRGFKSLERVRVSGMGTRKMVGASRSGTFVVRLPYSGNCAGFTVSAVGSKGSRASINFAHIHCIEP